jgi:hypothetical protein
LSSARSGAVVSLSTGGWSRSSSSASSALSASASAADVSGDDGRSKIAIS